VLGAPVAWVALVEEEPRPWRRRARGATLVAVDLTRLLAALLSKATLDLHGRCLEVDGPRARVAM
jgi:hypothetical protein